MDQFWDKVWHELNFTMISKWPRSESQWQLLICYMYNINWTILFSVQFEKENN